MASLFWAVAAKCPSSKTNEKQPYISAGPCLPGATRLRRMENQSLIFYPNCFSTFHHQFINLCKFPLTNQQLIHQLVINLLFAGLQVSNLGLVTVLLYPLDRQFTTHQVGALKFGWSWKSMKFQCISNTPTNHQNGLPRPPKVSKMSSQEVPEVIKITKMLKKWNLMKTLVFAILLRGWDIRIHENFHSKIIKKRDCNRNVILNCSNQRKY